MRFLLITAFALFSTGAFAQDLSMCTSGGNSVKCCKESVAKYGPFGSVHGKGKRDRLADIQACMAHEAKK